MPRYCNNQGAEPYFDDPASYGEGTDFQDLIYDPALTQNYQVGVRGGNETTKYALSGNFLDEGGILRNTGFRRYSFRSNLDQDISDRFRVGANITASRGQFDEGRTGGGGERNSTAYSAARYVPILDAFDDDPSDNGGRYTQHSTALRQISSPGFAPTININFGNPVALVNEMKNEVILNRVLGNVYAEFDLTENLYVRSSFGADIEDGTRELFINDQLGARQYQNYARTRLRNQTNYVSENLLKYNSTLGEVHDLDLTAGFTWQNEETTSQQLNNTGFFSSVFQNDNLGAATQPNVGSSRSEWTLLSYLGRANYTFRPNRK